MNCPKCSTPLVVKYYKGMLEVESCPACRGMWLEIHELDRLEDMAFNEDARKGSLIHESRLTEYPCPHCEAPLHEFTYRLYDLHLDGCLSHHGFWLDGGEDERVLEIMRSRAASLKRPPEAEWQQVLQNLLSIFR